MSFRGVGVLWGFVVTDSVDGVYILRLGVFRKIPLLRVVVFVSGCMWGGSSWRFRKFLLS